VETKVFEEANIYETDNTMSSNVRTETNLMSDADVTDLSTTLVFAGLKEVSVEYTVFRFLSHNS
jgi:hypothetical protein